jgi:anti-sigma factor RsiW
MNCHKIQELILTDYIDGEMKEPQKRQLEEHLLHCVRCQEYAAAAQKSVVEPFLDGKNFTPPASFWSRIEEEIRSRQLEKTESVFDWWRGFQFAPRPVFAAAMGIILILFVGAINHVRINNQEARKGQDQIEYLAALIDTPGDIYSNDENGFGTTIEEYFL